MPQTVEISSTNFSGEQANIIFTPIGSDIVYGLGIQSLPYIFDSSILGDEVDAIGTYSINIVNSNCTHILVIS